MVFPFNIFILVGGVWDYNKYKNISSYAQKSVIRKQETSMKIDKYGNFVFDKWGASDGVESNFLTTDREVIHTHPNKGGGWIDAPSDFSDGSGDIPEYRAYYNRNPQSTVRFTVVGRDNIYFTTNRSLGFSPPYKTFQQNVFLGLLI